MNHITDDDLIDYLHNEVGDALDVQIHTHLASCRECTVRYDDAAAIGDRLRASAFAQERELPPMIRANVWAAIRASEPTFAQRVRAFISPLVAVPVAATIALLLYLGIPVVRGDRATGSPTVTAAYYFEEHAAQAQENPLADHVNPNSSLALGTGNPNANAPLIDAADAATIDDLVAARK